ncbi:MAG TPA: double-cubane-cluster-containing anaerobic reductase [Thermodesulfobacteriota bacterium]|nr:double-cubane-cluster-containing anaerobic reductase [Thermodesulfobacteriota bacterium]
MPDDYRGMWTDLGLNLEAHDQLLEVLGKVYADIFLSQQNRPKKADYLDFVMSEIHGLRIKELLDGKKQGHMVVGTYCTFVPEEIIIAAQGVMVGLCAGADFATDKVDQYLPKNLCALIKSTFGFKLGRVCPYLEASDIVVGENTCDGKKKAYEVLQGLVRDLYVIDLPQMKNADARKLLRNEYRKFMGKMEQLSGNTITMESLKRAITIVNAKRQAMHRLSRLRASNPVPISGLDSLLINQIFFYENPLRFTTQINVLCDELEDRIKSKAGVAPPETPRLLISGCPMAVPNWKLPAIVETSGGVIVGEESCIGERGARNLVDAHGETMDTVLDAIVDRYLSIDCAVFTPNPDRLAHIRDMVKTYNADGVILYAIQFCTPYTVEGISIARALEKDGIPVIRIETDYTQEDAGQLKTRIQAFIEMVKG